jgi:hypothetical protein
MIVHLLEALEVHPAIEAVISAIALVCHGFSQKP